MRFALAALFFLLASLSAPIARAHPLGVSQSEITLDDDGLHSTVVFARADAVKLGHLGESDGGVKPPDASAFRDLVATGIAVTSDGAPCAAILEGGGDTEGDGFGLAIRWACARPVHRLEARFPFLSLLSKDHRHVARITSGDASVQKIVTRSNSTIAFEMGSVSAPLRSFLRLVRESIPWGMSHIWTGWDHLLFLIALVLGCRGMRPLVVTITAFTVAHSTTLALAGSGVIAAHPRWVEPLVAASIALAAIDNLIRPQARSRWGTAFAFGLIHGLAFASALVGVDLSRGKIVPRLLGFNLGVEFGQIAIVFALAWLLERSGLHGRKRWMQYTSITLALGALAVCVMRVFDQLGVHRG